MYKDNKNKVEDFQGKNRLLTQKKYNHNCAAKVKTHQQVD